MCGIVGCWSSDGALQGSQGEIVLRTMAQRIAHRGPDSEGYWADDEVGIRLAHRRLAILDLTSAGSQPMGSGSGRNVLVFNGEIYNCGELRTALEAAGQAPNWRGHSDTEVLLACIDAWG